MTEINEYGEILGRESGEPIARIANKGNGETGFIGLDEIAKGSGLADWVERHPKLDLEETLRLELLQAQKEQIEHEMELSENDNQKRRLLEQINQEIQVISEEERSSEAQEAARSFKKAAEMFDKRAGTLHKGDKYGAIVNILAAAKQYPDNEKAREKRREVLRRLSEGGL